MDRAIDEWALGNNLSCSWAVALAQRLTKSYTVYGCMLLLPANAFEHPGWANVNSELVDRLYVCMVRHLKITHVAVNQPIPPLQPDSHADNILRAPCNFTPVYGDFGPPTCDDPPTPANFHDGFWVTAKQNGIHQTWAPRWTMFSRGNVSEKARLLTLPSVQRAVDEGRAHGSGAAAVDLYAGIGYFAFSYVKAGVEKVLCWDLNPWSIEGLQRGAKANKWQATVFRGDPATLEQMPRHPAQFLIFSETNEMAPQRLDAMRSHLPPVRHVNCGMLPSSRASLRLAAAILDPRHHGWVHVHENFAVSEIAQRAEQTRQELQSWLHVTRGGLGGNGAVETAIETVFRLKSYAPGVMHCVIDIVVHPTLPV